MSQAWRAPRSYKKNLVTSISTLTKNKVEPIEVAINMVSALSTLQLRIVGDGPEKPRLVSLCEELGVSSRVEFVGTTHNPRPFIEQAAVVLGVGRVALESASRGVPVVIASDGKIFGSLKIDNFVSAQKYNFTGRNPDSTHLSVKSMKKAVLEALKYESSQLNDLGERASKVGDLTPLLKVLR